MWSPQGPYVLLQIILVLSLALSAPIGQGAPGGQGGLLIITTFPNLIYDVELISAPDDEISSIAPLGADPHDYQLTPDDISLLKKADLIISTVHAPFEAEIRRLHDEGEIRGELVEIPDIPGVEIFENPATGQPNYHMPIYDPDNYVSFVLHIRGLLTGLRPEKADYYRDKSRAVLTAIYKLVSETPELGLRAAADLPSIQYAVGWLGVEITFLLVKEHDVPATPSDMLKLREAVSEGLIDLVVVSEPVKASASRYLEDIAEENGIPILYVPSPLISMSILDKLSLISQRAKGIVKPGASAGGAAWWRTGLVLATATALVLLAIFSAALALYARG